MNLITQNWRVKSGGHTKRVPEQEEVKRFITEAIHEMALQNFTGSQLQLRERERDLNHFGQTGKTVSTTARPKAEQKNSGRTFGWNIQKEHSDKTFE